MNHKIKLPVPTYLQSAPNTGYLNPNFSVDQHAPSEALPINKHTAEASGGMQGVPKLPSHPK